MEAEKTNTVEIIEPEIVAASEPKVPSREELRKTGWSAKELDMAEKRGMIGKPDEKKTEAIGRTTDAEVKTDAEAKPKEEEVKNEAKTVEKPKSSLPDFTIKDPAQEKVFLDTFGPGTPQRAMYFRMKNERQQRQAAEARARELEARLHALEQGRIEKKPEVDEDGNEIDPDNKPLTPKMLREMKESEAAEQLKKEQELRDQGNRVANALRDQEEYAKSINPDFDDTVKMAAEVMQKLDELVPDTKTQRRIIKLMQDLQVAAANADKLTLDDYNAADISYEIGKFHPSYGKSANGAAHADDDGKSERPEPKANGSLTPEQMKRLEANTQRRASSASVSGGGGKRTVSVDDIGLKELNAMNSTERIKFKTSHPERYAKLMRG